MSDPSTTDISEINPDQTKNIIVLCDGTANQVTVYSETNVIRIAERLDKTGIKGKRQVLFYDPGLGTENAPGALTFIGKAVTKILGLAFGYGLSKNLADAYAFLMQNYEPGDRIYIFGFSRGAYTARALTGLLGRVGLLERGCNSLIPYAIKYYHESNTHQLNFFKKRFSRTYDLTWGELISDPSITTQKELMKKVSRGVIPVHFLGVWDTVKSIGILRRQITLPDTDWLPNMINGRHAVAIHERRSQYQPELWHADTDDNHEEQVKLRKGNFQTCLHQDVQTMWFPGVHADVGGGYGLPAKLEKELIEIRKNIKEIDWDILPKARKENDTEKVTSFVRLKKELDARKKVIKQELANETALAYNSLEWMISAAEKHGLRFKKVKVDLQEVVPRIHNPLRPFWWILGSKERPGPMDTEKYWQRQ